MTENSYKYDERGKLKKGYTANPDGRGTREREAAYLLIMKEVVGAKEFRTLWQEAYLGARGKKISHILNPQSGNTEPQLIDDADSTPATRLGYLRFIQENLVGKPIEKMIVDDAQGKLLDEWLELEDQDLDLIMNKAYGKSQSIIAANLREARKIIKRGMANKSGRRRDRGGDSSAGGKETANQETKHTV